jgi:glycosyltransferase involved in cell wall biosynthesis
VNNVDVIVPCYRYGHYLRECVTSVLDQTGVDVRVLIIDDASPDNTAEVASELASNDSRVTFLQHYENKGHIATYNEGIEWVAADYLLLLSADDYLLPGTLQSATNLMETFPEIGFTYGKAIELKDTDIKAQNESIVHASVDKPKWQILKGIEFIELAGAHNIVPTPTAVVRTELQKRLGGYRPELPHSGDMEMWLRLSAFGFVGISQDYQAVYRLHDNNMSKEYMTNSWWLPDLKQRKSALNCFFHTCKKNLPNSQALHHKLFRLLALDAISLASTAFNEGQMTASRQLADYAIEIDPNIRQSYAWHKLAFKRFVGLKTWSALAFIASPIRQ